MLVAVGALAAGATLLVGCDDPDGGRATDTCENGTVGCRCSDDGTCEPGLTCSAGNVCEASCEVGTRDCPCSDDGTCNDDSLTCSAAGVCEELGCLAGTNGCSCTAEGTCSGDGRDGEPMECRDGLCVDASCVPGALGCPCQEDGTCSSSALTCSSLKLCTDEGCPAGTAGCACEYGGSCGTTARGAELTCSGGVCSDCKAEACVPASPACFTPCRTGFTDAEGAYHPCDADGLLRHEDGAPCLDGKICTEGTCVDPDGQAPRCDHDIDCPDFQNCVGGRCYAVCDEDTACPDGLACFRHACRESCTAADQTCGAETACTLVDGENGFCMPVGAAPEGPDEGVVLGTFEVSTESIAFDSGNIEATFTITNTGPVAATFTVAKVEHTEGVGGYRVTKNPMPWLSIGEPGSEALQNELEVLVDPDVGPVTISVKGAATESLSRWQGVLEVRSNDQRLGVRQVNLSYVGEADGRWAGTLYYFANFGDHNLDAWVQNRDDFARLQVVGNALVRRWGDLRRGQVSPGNFEAALQSAVTGSWKWPTVARDCRKAACYPYVDPANPLGAGIEEFSDSLEEYPVPSDVSQLPIAFDLETSHSDKTLLTGRIPTSEALQYSGNPAVELRFGSAPDGAECDVAIAGHCVMFASSLEAVVNVGGRYLIDGFGTPASCPTGWRLSQTPWLVPGFVALTGPNPDSGLLYRSECRDESQPGGSLGMAIPLNVSLAGANPIPDGRTRSRRLALVDGAIIDQDSMVLLVKETFDSVLGASGPSEVSAYGVISVRRTAAELPDDAFDGNQPPAPVDPPPAAERSLACSSELLDKIGLVGNVSATNAGAVVDALLNGKALGAEPQPLQIEQVHYLCHDTGRFDGGNTATNGGAPFDCPAGSNVTYFYFEDTASMPTAAQIAALPCQDAGSCQQTLNAWRTNHVWGISADAPVYRCQNANEVFCNGNRSDLRVGKEFFAPGPGSLVFTPLRTAVNDAFRYKTQFRSRSGANVGFAPEPCVPNSDAVPYCYDAADIEEARDRVDCALSVYHEFGAGLDAVTRSALFDYLETNFAYEQTINPPLFTYDGFEAMYAELLVMLGDDAYTSSFMARFDLAGSNKATFQGSLFEADGIDLSGAAGFEMYELYQATQHYGLVLERLYQLAPYLLTASGFEQFVTAPTFTYYFPKLVRASAQRTRAWSEIAKRYQSFNRPDLARRVIERAYTSAYLESVVIGNLVTRYLPNASAEKADVEQARKVAALTYGAALLDMRDVYQTITDDVTIFGFAPDFIPFPALQASDTNAFTNLLTLARQRAAVAAEKEQAALSSNRSYETDAASFQSELVKLRINYENQLAEICGTFTGDDGQVYPAIPRYAYLSPETTALGDPCGFVGTGNLYEAMGQLEIVQLDLKQVQQRFANLGTEIEIERQRVSDQCGITARLAEAAYELAGEKRSIQDDINDLQTAKLGIDWLLNGVNALVEAMGCVAGVATDCPTKAAALGTYLATTVPLRISDVAFQSLIFQKEQDMAKREAEHVRWQSLQGCDAARVDSEAGIRGKMLQLASWEIDALKAEYGVRLSLSRVQALRDRAQRVANEMDEMEEQTINIEAARNDPNVRIYKNDAIINADRAFDSAVAAAYQATKVYEYYTSRSYARLQNLYLVRMVSYGDYNLENYLAELEDAYLGFEQEFGNPDDRVEILSLRDDVFEIPRLGSSGEAVPQSRRIEQFRERLADVSLLDERGYLTIPFATTVTRLSPLTRNHKIKRLEVELVGSDVGDTLGRIYVRQKGTGVVRAVGGDTLYYRFPELTAVLDPFFNGVRAFDPSIYLSDRLRDRPVANSRWDLVVNQKDEVANQDIDLKSLTDVRLYVYYTDFTAQ